MSLSPVNPQVFLVRCRKSVVLFCCKVLQNYATIHEVNDIAQIQGSGRCLIVYDAMGTSQPAQFADLVHPDLPPIISILSPVLDFSTQLLLKKISRHCFYMCDAAACFAELEQYLKAFFTDDSVIYSADKLSSGLSLSENLGFYSESFFEGLFLGDSKAIQEFRAKLRLVADLDSPVLLLGESGCGKSSAAKLMHKHSRRKSGPFIPVTVAEIVPSLCESAFFGKTSGAYTDAKSDTGYFIRANHGDLFLDEIGTLSLLMQSKILTAIEDKMITPVGTTKAIKIDVRIFFATNADLKAKLLAGTFRNDLLNRINHYVLKIPSLKERPEDIPCIAEAYLKKNNIEKILTADSLEKLMTYKWIGNVRELHNCLDRAVLLSTSELILPESIDFGVFS